MRFNSPAFALAFEASQAPPLVAWAVRIVIRHAGVPMILNCSGHQLHELDCGDPRTSLVLLALLPEVDMHFHLNQQDGRYA